MYPLSAYTRSPKLSPMLSHLNANNQPTMVNVAAKEVTYRTAHALAIVTLPAPLAQLMAGNEIASKKGPVFQTAILAGVMGAKKTSELIPLCHPLALENCQIEIETGKAKADGSVDVLIHCRASLHGKTGVEMEALTGASVAALTLYDMGKAVSHDIVIREIRLLEKTGGKSDYQGSL
jgi:cyclic pyranopterin monophosphate synthase